MTASTPASASAAPPKKKYSLRETVVALSRPRVASMAALGFSSGLPFMLTGATFAYWLRDAGAELTTIGFLSWVGLAYTFKFVWAPVVDKVKLPALGKLGQRRSWAILVQLIIGACLLAMAAIGPSVGPPVDPAGGSPVTTAVGPGQLVTLGAFALIVAFASATQDIAVDAWRIEEARDNDELGMFTAAYQLGYRVALLIADALILSFAKHLGWPLSYAIMALLMGVGLFAAFRTPEPERRQASSVAAAVGTTQDSAIAQARRAAGAFMLAAAATWVLTFLPKWDWLGIFGLSGVHSLFGNWFAAACIVLAAGAYFRIPQTWIAGATVLGALVLVAFYGAVSGANIIAGAPLFWPAMLCLVGAGLSAPPRIYDAVLGPLIEFFRHHGWFAAVMLLMISVYRLPEFVIGPVAGPFYSDLGIDKDVVAAVRGSVGLVAAFSGIAAGGVAAAALGFKPTLLIGAVLQGLGVATFALLAFNGASIPLFSFAMAADNFCYAFAGVALIAYMSSLTSVGYTATQYALLSSIYTVFGKFLKGFSGAVVDGFQASGSTLMEAYGLFYVGAGLIAAPAFVLCLVILARRVPKTSTAAA